MSHQDPPDCTGRAREYLHISQTQLGRVADHLDQNFDHAVHAIVGRLRLGGKLVCTGMGKSYHIAAKAAATFTSTGSPATLLHPSEAPHGDLGILQDGDVVLALSYSGETAELIQLVPLLRRVDVCVIGITGSAANSLSRLCDHNLCVAIEREACPFNLAPTTSALVTLAVCDALAMLVQEQRGFTREQYRSLHPGGAIGQTLLLRVSDIMRSGDRLPSVQPDHTVSDAVVCMTRCKSGAVGVTDANQTVLGVFTDGDLRRSLQTGSPITQTPVKRVMTPNPVCIPLHAPLTDALEIFTQRNIDDLLVVDEQNRLVGIVDLQDIPKLKLFSR